MEHHWVRGLARSSLVFLLICGIESTVLSSAGNDGRIRLWKATAGNVWRPAGSVGVEQATGEPNTQTENKDVDMDS